MKIRMTVLAIIGVMFMVTGLAQAGDGHASDSHVNNNHGMINKKSTYGVKETLDRLEAVLKKKGITIVTRWSHDAGAKKADIPLRPTELLLFGNLTRNWARTCSPANRRRVLICR